MNHEYFMMQAVFEARQAGEQGEVPVGAVIVKDDKIIGRGGNKKEKSIDPTSHAEIEAIKDACLFLNDWRLNDSLIYITAEPCVMCCGAIIHARISRVFFGVSEPKFGGVLSKASIFDITSFNHRVEWLSGICDREISEMMKNFFKNKR